MSNQRVLTSMPAAWIAVGIILFGVWCAWSQDAPVGSPGQVVVTQRAIRHIEDRHWPDSPAQGAGKFASGVTEDSLRTTRERSCRSRAHTAQYKRTTWPNLRI